MRLSSVATSTPTTAGPSLTSVQFFTFKDIPQTVSLIISHFLSNKFSYQQSETSNFQTHISKFLHFAAQKNTSFVVKADGNVLGCCICLDIKDLMHLFQKTINLAVFEPIGIFSTALKNWAYSLAGSLRGDYLFNCLTVFSGTGFDWVNLVDNFLRGIAFCKLVGWKAILFHTGDPFLLLKMGGKIMGVISAQNRSPLEHNKQEVECFLADQSQRSPIKKISENKNNYVIVMKLDELKFKYIGEEVHNIQVKENSPIQYEENQEIQRKLDIYPKL